MGRLAFTTVCLLGLMFPYAAPWVCASRLHLADMPPPHPCHDGTSPAGHAAAALTAPSAGCGIAQCPTAQTATCSSLAMPLTLLPTQPSDSPTRADSHQPGALPPPTPPPIA